MTESFRPTLATIDLAALRENFSLLRGLAPGPKNGDTFICPMIKANGYGHGLIGTARALRLESAPHLGVALVEEGVLLRESGDQGSILAFGLFLDRASSEAALELNLTVVAHSWEQLQELAAAASKLSLERPSHVHLEFNTGMNRHGFSSEDSERLRRWFETQSHLRLAGLCTHLASGNDVGREGSMSTSQLAAFEQIVDVFRGLDLHLHVLNSGAAIAYAKRLKSSARVWGLRPGLALYGIQPSEEPDLQIPLKPALKWTSRLAAVHRVMRGESVSYDATWKAARDSYIGVVPCGYGDGFSRALSNRGSVLCRETRAPLIGRVCMDAFMVDLTDVQHATGDLRVGDELVLIGKQGDQEIRADEMARVCGTISYEILTAISARVPRVYSPADVGPI